jgi:hypothetical protein
MKFGQSGRFWLTSHGLRDRLPVAHARLKGRLGLGWLAQPNVKAGLVGPAGGAQACELLTVTACRVAVMTQRPLTS